MAEVIKGLELLHTTGYVHRDIKLQNILVKYEEKDKAVFLILIQRYKLADFGFAKKQNDLGGTLLGT